MITGRNGMWKVVCKDAMRNAKIPQLASLCCDVRSHSQAGHTTASLSACLAMHVNRQ